MFASLASIGIAKKIGKHKSAVSEHRTGMARFNREERIMGMFEKEDKM